MAMSGNFGIIEHEGVVEKSDGNTVIVRISPETACSGCHAEVICNLSGVKEKLIEVHGNYNVSPGDRVKVLMKKSMGYSAVFLSYIFPLILILIILIILLSIHLSEVVAGLGSVGILGIYYLILYLFRNRIRNKFTFSIKTL